MARRVGQSYVVELSYSSSDAALTLDIDSYAFVRLPVPSKTMNNTPYVPRVMVTANLTSTNQNVSIFRGVFWNFEWESGSEVVGVSQKHLFADAAQVQAQPERGFRP